MILKGFRFGMLLQFAIGPVCIFIFQAGSEKGFYSAETGVFGVAVIDGLYILAAILGMASIIDRNYVKLGLKVFGAVILCVFGISTIISQFNISLFPGLNMHNNSGIIFFRAILITISNPLTILFWAGVFSAKISEENMNKSNMYAYGFGAIMSTICFLTLIAFLGSITKTFLPTHLIQIFNLIVGLILIYFSIRIIFKKV